MNLVFPANNKCEAATMNMFHVIAQYESSQGGHSTGRTRNGRIVKPISVPHLYWLLVGADQAPPTADPGGAGTD